MWHQHLADAGFEQITDPVAKLEHGLRISIRYLSENRELYQFIFTESKYMDREHLREGPGAGRPERGGLLPAPALARSPDGPARAARPSWPPTWSPIMCIFLALRGWNLDLHRSGRRGRGRRVPCRFHLPRSGHRARSRASEEAREHVGDPKSGRSGSGAHGHRRGGPSGQRRHPHAAPRPGARRS